jgi:hypothetical protein
MIRREEKEDLVGTELKTIKLLSTSNVTVCAKKTVAEPRALCALDVWDDLRAGLRQRQNRLWSWLRSWPRSWLCS